MNWNNTYTRTDYLLDRGYTGHEHFDSVGLIHMNGRMYDPILGRMLSPDPLLQNPFNSKNHNRYSYVLNNPLKYTDPSGCYSVREGGFISHKDFNYFEASDAQVGFNLRATNFGVNRKTDFWWAGLVVGYSFFETYDGQIMVMSHMLGGKTKQKKHSADDFLNNLRNGNYSGHYARYKKSGNDDVILRIIANIKKILLDKLNEEIYRIIESGHPGFGLSFTNEFEVGNPSATNSGGCMLTAGPGGYYESNEPFYLNHEQVKEFKSLPGSKISEVVGVVDYFRSNLTNSTPVVGWILTVYTINSWMLNPQIERVYDNYTDHKNHEGVNIYFNSIYDRFSGQTTQIIDVYDKKDNYYTGSIYY